MGSTYNMPHRLKRAMILFSYGSIRLGKYRNFSQRDRTFSQMDRQFRKYRCFPKSIDALHRSFLKSIDTLHRYFSSSSFIAQFRSLPRQNTLFLQN